MLGGHHGTQNEFIEVRAAMPGPPLGGGENLLDV